jgi:hypothetical protein
MFFTAAGASLVAFAIGTDFALRAQSLANDENAKDPLLRSPDARNKVSSETVAANGFFIGGAVFAAGAAVLAFTTNWRADATSTTSVSLAPWIGPSGGGASARGSF